MEEQLTEEVEELMEKAEEGDAEDFPEETSVPEEIARREERLEKIREAKRTIEERAQKRHEEEKAAYEEKMEKRREEEKRTGRKKPGPNPEPPEDTGPEPDDQVNLTDEASRIMFTGENGFQQAYNAQATVCMNSHLILEGHLSQKTNDKQELDPALQKLDQLPEKVGSPDRLAADSGYYSSGNVEACEDHRITPYISAGREEHNQVWKERFSEPEGTPEEASGLEAMAYRLETREGKDFYGRRKGTAEPIFGIVKEVMGIRQSLLRGLKKVKGEWALIRCAFNLKRMHRLLGQAA